MFDLFKKSGQLLFKLGVLTLALLSEVVGSTDIGPYADTWRIVQCSAY